MKKYFTLVYLVIFCLLAVLGGGVGGFLAVSTLQPSPVQPVSAYHKTGDKTYVEESSIIDTVKKVSPAVVSIVISKDLPLYQNRAFTFDQNFFNDPFSNMPFQFQVPKTDQNGKVETQRQKVGGGSGFIVSEDGLVVTNKHVVDDPEASYSVILSDGRTFKVANISADQINDLAVLKLATDDGKKISNLPTVKLGDSSAIQVGQRVVAFGNALAEYDNTVTTGIISAKGRSLTAGAMQTTENLLNLIQTDASINPGNSGGPLVDLNGEVIGINTAIAAGAEGIGFAIPSNDVKSVIESVQKNGKIVRPYLGVRYLLLDEAKAKELQIDVKGGALLTGDEANGEFAVIPGSPADKAGLRMKDVILSVDGQTVTADSPLQVLIGQKNPGDTVTLHVWRSGKEMDVKVTLEESK